jgi:hypothetical protein
MGLFMTICGLGALGFSGWLAITSVVTDIQHGIVVTSVIGGLVLIGLGQLFERLERSGR